MSELQLPDNITDLEQATNAFQKFAGSTTVNFSFATTYFQNIRKSHQKTKSQFRNRKMSNNPNNNSPKSKLAGRMTLRVDHTCNQINYIKKRLNTSVAPIRKSINQLQIHQKVTKKNKNEQPRQKRYKTLKDEKLKGNPNITDRSFYVNVLTPNLKSNNTKISNEVKEFKLTNNLDDSFEIINMEQDRKQSTSKNSKSDRSGANFNSLIMKHYNKIVKKSPRTSNFDKIIKQLDMKIRDKDIKNRLAMFSGNPPDQLGQKALSNIRVYKDDYRRIFINRYGKDRITHFLQFEYIVQFGQIQKIMFDIMKFTRQQMLVLVFLIFDHDRDGLISAEDLIALHGTSKSKITTNLLIEADICKIINYVKNTKNQGKIIYDSVVHYQVFKDETLSIMKYRKYNFQQKKNKSGNRDKAKSILTKRINEHLFTLKESTNSQLNDKTDKNLKLKGLLHFSTQIKEMNEFHKFYINFDRFCEIFDSVPETFIDILYVFGGLSLPKYHYSKIDWSIFNLQSHQIKKVSLKQDRFLQCFEKLDKMKKIKKSMIVEKW